VNLHLFARVLWRFKYVVAAGSIVALLLSILTVAELPSLKPRTPTIYGSNATLLITQPGFPWGSAVQQWAQSSRRQAAVPAGDLARLTSLANLYVQLANSDVIRQLVVRETGPQGKITAIQNYSMSPSYYSTALPIMTLTGSSTSPAKAIAVTQAGVDSLTGYLKQKQQTAGIDDTQRVVVQELQRPRTTFVVQGTKKTLPIAVFLTVMLAVTGLCFVLENLRPRVPLMVVAGNKAESSPDRARRSA
jgi:hypothetical protein